MPSPRLSLAPTFLSSFSPLLLRKEIQPFHLCLSLCVVLDLGFPPLNETFCHQGNEKFSHPHVFSFWYGGTFSRPCSLPGVLSVKCVCCNERIMTNEMKLNRFDQMGIALECSIMDQYLIWSEFCFDDASLKQRSYFHLMSRKENVQKWFFFTHRGICGLVILKGEKQLLDVFSNCNRSKQNVTVGSRFKVLKNRTTSAVGIKDSIGCKILGCCEDLWEAGYSNKFAGNYYKRD